jgi:hypothetical protein
MSSVKFTDGIPTTRLFLVTAAIEVVVGVALLVAPDLVIRVLLGPSDQAGAVGRLAGAALLSLGSICWWARHDSRSSASRGLMNGLLIYNAAVVGLVLSGSLGSPGAPLWSVAVIHGAMAIWCAWLLWVGR